MEVWYYGEYYYGRWDLGIFFVGNVGNVLVGSFVVWYVIGICGWCEFGGVGK